MININDSVAKTKILKAIVEDPEIVLLLKEKYVDDEVWKFCIEREPTLFKKMKRPNEAICVFACSVDGGNLKYIKNKFKHILITGTLCMISVKSNPKAILYVPKSLMNDELKEMAFDNDPSLMIYFDDIREEYVEKIIREKPYAIQYIKRINEKMICDVIKESPAICTYFNKMTPMMIATLAEHHPNYYSLYKNNITCEDYNNGRIISCQK